MAWVCDDGVQQEVEDDEPLPLASACVYSRLTRLVVPLMGRLQYLMQDRDLMD